MITKAGIYYLGQSISENLGLKEFTSAEYESFRLAGWQQIFKDEKIYHGRDVKLNGYSWKNVLIGIVDHKVYKISLQISSPDAAYIDDVFKSTLSYLIKEMGDYNEHRIFTKRYIWDRAEGNVVYELLNRYGYYFVNLYLTASFISKLPRDRMIIV